MKTKNLILTIIMVISATAISFAQANTAAESGINAFSFSEYLLMSLCVVLLVTIWLLAKTVKQLAEQMR